MEAKKEAIDLFSKYPENDPTMVFRLDLRKTLSNPLYPTILLILDLREILWNMHHCPLNVFLFFFSLLADDQLSRGNTV